MRPPTKLVGSDRAVQRLEALDLVCEFGSSTRPPSPWQASTTLRSARLAAECAHEVPRLTHGKASNSHAEQLEYAAQRDRLAGLQVDQIDARPAAAAGLHLADLNVATYARSSSLTDEGNDNDMKDLEGTAAGHREAT